MIFTIPGQAESNIIITTAIENKRSLRQHQLSVKSLAQMAGVWYNGLTKSSSVSVWKIVM